MGFGSSFLLHSENMKKFYLICAACVACVLLFASLAVVCKCFAWVIPAMMCMAGAGSAAVYIMMNEEPERTNRTNEPNE